MAPRPVRTSRANRTCAIESRDFILTGAAHRCLNLQLPVPSPLLSKSAFKLALACPRRLAYQREGYPSSKGTDAYLEFLTDGGFMVEAMAHALFPTGRMVEPAPGQTAAATAAAALSGSAPVVLVEAVFEHAGCSARVDILCRRNGHIDLIEVKSSSFDSTKGANPFRSKQGKIIGKWLPYLQDLAFQTMVVRGALGPSTRVTPKLCLVDKSKTCTEDAIFRRIELVPRPDREFGQPSARYTGDAERLLQDHLLAFIDATAEVEELLADASSDGLVATAQRLAAAIGLSTTGSGTLRDIPITRDHKCRDCPYRGASITPQQPDGFAECWGQLAKGEPHLLELIRIDLLHGKGGKAIPDLLDKGISAVADIPREPLERSDGVFAARQLRQINCVRSGKEWQSSELRSILESQQPPFHFVDFETSRLAVPYHAGMHPYEQVSFQFSCHTLPSIDATELVHREWINLEDHWPNVEFAQALRAAIGDSGQMLVWSHHEKSALTEIRQQIIEYHRGPAELADWLEPLTRNHDDNGRIVDLYRLCEDHYMHPSMDGKYGIKAVLPAIWNNNPSLQQHPWFKEYLATNDGQVLSPYDSLPPIDLPGGAVSAVREGTAAMTAYQDMLYGLRRGDPAYRAACRAALLQYCKLDTLAMVIVWMHWMRASSLAG